jgi:hypothetical protein
LATDWQVQKLQVKLETNAVRGQEILNKCEGYWKILRHELRQHEDLQTQQRQMYELDHSKDQIMTLFKVALASLLNVGERSLFWRELSALWLATFVALFQIGRTDYHDR